MFCVLLAWGVQTLGCRHVCEHFPPSTGLFHSLDGVSDRTELAIPKKPNAPSFRAAPSSLCLGRSALLRGPALAPLSEQPGHGPWAFWAVGSVPLLDPLCRHGTVFGTVAFEVGSASPFQNRVGYSSFAPPWKLKISFSTSQRGRPPRTLREIARSSWARLGRTACSLRRAPRSVNRPRLRCSALLRGRPRTSRRWRRADPVHGSLDSRLTASRLPLLQWRSQFTCRRHS